MYLSKEMLTSALKALDKRFKMEILSWNLCIQHIKTSKSNIFYIKVYQLFLFIESLTRILRAFVSKTHLSILNTLTLIAH